MCVGPYVKYTSFLPYLDVTLTLWTEFRKILKYQILVMKEPAVGTELVHADRSVG